MPLLHSSSPAALKQNMRTLHSEIGHSPHVKNRAQAIAIALNTQREARKHHRATGGGMPKHLQVGGSSGFAPWGWLGGFGGFGGYSPWGGFGGSGIAPQVSSMPAATPAAGAGLWGLPAGSGAPVSSPRAAPLGAATPQALQAASVAPQRQPQPPQPQPSSLMPVGGAGGLTSGAMRPAFGAGVGGIGVGGMAFGGVASPKLTNPMSEFAEKAEARSLSYSHPVLSAVQKFGSFRRQQGGIAPFAEKMEARGLMHTGPILSAVPGRTDRHETQVPSGAYVIPAETVSHLGQSNTLAGMKVLNRMFGPSGRYNAGRPLNPGAPSVADRGGARGEGVGAPTDVVVAGGEFVIPPSVVMSIGGGNLARGHRILDKWVMSLRDDHIRTLKGLKPPAKS